MALEDWQIHEHRCAQGHLLTGSLLLVKEGIVAGRNEKCIIVCYQRHLLQVYKEWHRDKGAHQQWSASGRLQLRSPLVKVALAEMRITDCLLEATCTHL
jgi:hypothetical protein